MSAKEFGEWAAYDKISPGMPERQDILTAMLCMIIANAHKGKKGKAFTIDDFLLTFKPKKVVQQSSEELKMKLGSWMNVHNAVQKANEQKKKKKGK